MLRYVVVFDAADLEQESAFWTGMFEAHALKEDDFHCVVDDKGEWRVGVQRAPDHVPPNWPDGAPQQIHLDLHVVDSSSATKRRWRSGPGSCSPPPTSAQKSGHQVYAGPAGHPFCIGWGHPSKEALASFAATRWGGEQTE